MQKAQREISHYDEYDYCLINDNFDDCLSKLWAIIIANRNISNPEYNKNINIIKSLLKNYDK
jgi:guanylate kinase